MKKLDINDLTMTPEERMHVYSSFVGDDKHFSVEGLLETIAAHEKVKEANESIATAARDFR